MYHLVSLSTNTATAVFPSRVGGNATIRSIVTVDQGIQESEVVCITLSVSDYLVLLFGKGHML